MTTVGTDDRARKARAEASAWIARLHGPQRTPELEAGLQRWLAESEINAREFEAVTEVWDGATGIAARGLPRMSEQAAASRPRANVRPRLAWGVAASVLIAALAFTLYDRWFAHLYSTQIGEQRIVMLGDGTQVSLNSGTRLRSDFSGDARNIVLERGEAFFEVAHDAARPFVVHAGTHAVTAVGTAFTVRREQGRVSVLLVKGKVAVSAVESSANDDVRVRTAATGETQLLEVGQRLTLDMGTPAVLDMPNIAATTAWRRGEIVLDETPLRAAIDELNRYTSRQLVLGDAELEQLRVSGLYHTGDSERFARAIAQLYDLQLENHEQRIVLRSR